MKNQRMKSERNRRTIKGLLFLTMLVILACVCGVLAHAESSATEPNVVLDSEALGLEYDSATGYWQKTYDGQTSLDATKVTVKLPGEQTPVVADKVLVVGSEDVTDLNANAGDRFIAVVYTQGTETNTLYLPLRIAKKQLTWSAESITGESVAYRPSTTDYETNVIIPESLKLNGLVAGEELVPQSGTAAFSAVALTDEDAKITVQTNLNCTADANTSAANYIIPPIAVVIDVTPYEILINDVVWSGYANSFVYGTDENKNGVFDALEISAAVKTDDGTTVQLNVVIQSETESLSLAEAEAKGLYGNVYASDETFSQYTVTALSPNALYKLVGGVASKTVEIHRAIFSVSMNEEKTIHIIPADLSDPDKVNSTTYQLLVNGDGIPTQYLEQITYTYKDAQGNVLSVNAVSVPGAYTVTATLPVLYSGENNEFANYAFNHTELSAEMEIRRRYLTVRDESGKSLILGCENGIPASLDADLTIPDSISHNATYGHPTYVDYTLALSGTQGETFTLYIPVDSSLTSAERTDVLTADDLYLYDGEADRMNSANKTYTVTLSEKGAYYVVDGFAPTAAVTFILAPGYEAPFWVTAPGIALIVFAILMVLFVLFLIGWKLHGVKNVENDNEVLTIDTEGELPTFDPIVIPDKIPDVETCLDEGLGRMAEGMRSDVEAAEEVQDHDVEPEDAVAEALKELKNEAALVDLYEEEHAAMAEMDEMTAQMAAKRAAELQKTVSASEEEVTVSDDAVSAAVAEALADAANMSADATDAIALIDEEVAEAPMADEDAEDDDNDDNASFKGFGSMSLNFIDAMAEPEKYNAMLEQERLGEIQIVTRYRRSYLSRLAQSQAPIQDYYNEIKNLLLSYKGVKNRISWGYEAFNLGRTPVAKFNAKTRMLSVYLALDPATLADTKYTFADMSAKKKYASVPVLMKVKGERKFKHTLEMITKLCEEQLQLPKKKVVEEQDYRLPFMDTEALVNEGMIKKMVAAMPMSEIDPSIKEIEVPETDLPKTDVAANAEVAGDENQNA